MKHFESIDALRKYAETWRCDVETYDDVLMFSPVGTRAAGPNIACLFGWDEQGAILEAVYVIDSDGDCYLFPWSAIPDQIVADFEEQYMEDYESRLAAYQDGEAEYKYEQARDRAKDAA
jgi:hypothetical protein